MLGGVGWENLLHERELLAFRRYQYVADRLYRIQFLRDVKDFFGTSFKIVSAEPSDPSSSELLYSCYGTGYVNVNRTLA